MTREQMNDTISAHWWELISQGTGSEAFEKLLLEARDNFIIHATFEELEQEIEHILY